MPRSKKAPPQSGKKNPLKKPQSEVIDVSLEQKELKPKVLSKPVPRRRKKAKIQRIEESIEENTSKALALVESSKDKSVAIADPMARYLAEIRRYPLLTPEEEREWAIRYFETKDPEAAEKLVTSNLRFVVKVAAEYSKFGARMIDLVQEGNVGLMHAVKEFNPYKGVKLITYAVWWIRGYIQEYLMRQYSMVRMGTTQTQRQLFYQLQRERQKLESMGQQAGIALLSSRLGIPENEVQEMEMRMRNRDLSLDAPLGDDERSTIIDLQTSPSEVSVDEQLGHQEELHLLRGKIEKIKEDLSDKEKYILENRLLSESPLTLQEIGDKYGMTRERARQLEARIIEKLKNA